MIALQWVKKYMRIGILTHHYVKNYGAFLQMKALYETLREVYPKADIRIVNFICQEHLWRNIIHVLHYRRKSDTPVIYREKIRQLRTFIRYECSLPRTDRVGTAEEIEALGFDLLVFGSDEIWNAADWGYHPLKFGAGFSEKTKRIAYAPSVGTFFQLSKESIREGIKGFWRVSGRDGETLDFLKRMHRGDAVRMPDPVFLYDFDRDLQKEGIEKKPFRYILIYDCKLTEKQEQQLRAYKDQHGFKLLGAGDYKKMYDGVTVNLTPYEWVSLFWHADKVITGTFHGTAFAIKYHRDFAAFPTERNRIQKVGSLLRDVGMEERMLSPGEEDKLCSILDRESDFTRADACLNRMKEEAFKFLSTG